MSKSCFVVGPIGADDSPERIHADWLLEAIIQPAIDEVGDFQISRADRITTPGQIDVQVIRRLLEDDLVIADLSLLNPNAFYEIGIRHMIQKPIIHMQLISEKIPFDVSLYRAIKFSLLRPADVSDASRRLVEQIRAILEPDYQVENPITLARGRVRLEERASPDERVVLEEIRSLSRRIDALESVPTISRTKLSNLINIEKNSPQSIDSLGPSGVSLVVQASEISAGLFEKVRRAIAGYGIYSTREVSDGAYEFSVIVPNPDEKNRLLADVLRLLPSDSVREIKGW